MAFGKHQINPFFIYPIRFSYSKESTLGGTCVHPGMDHEEHREQLKRDVISGVAALVTLLVYCTVV